MPILFFVTRKRDLFRQPSAKLVEDKPHERLCALDVTGWNHEVKAYRVVTVHQIVNGKV